MNDLPIQYRLRKESDDNLIFACWLSSQKYACQPTPNSLYQHDQEQKIRYLLNHSNTMVAYLDPVPNEPETLLAYLIYQYKDDHLLIHHAFTKSPFRLQGIQTNILSLINQINLPIIITCKPIETSKMIYDAFYFERQYYQ